VVEKLGWVREGAEAAGRSLCDIELEMNHWLVRITGSVGEGREFVERIAARYEVPPELLADSPSVLVGTVDQCVDTLQARREQLGFSYLQLDAGFAPKDIASLEPLIARLAGS
jgi:hypothetical protein